MKHLFCLLLVSVLLACGCSKSLPAFKAENQPAAPDYSLQQHWSTLPFHKDAADQIPKSETWINDSLKQVDVFYIYPTIYRDGDTWNADVANKKLNRKIDKFPVKYQASVFNRVGRIYAPRYRQGTYECFNDSVNGPLSLAFAYEDVKLAFEYYMAHYNQGRPIIIASHSQGTYHARKLLREYFDNAKMKEKLVCAYLVGYAIYPEQYQILTPCKRSTETNCYVTWATFKDGYNYPDEDKDLLVGDVAVNPVTWKMDTVAATGKGGFLLRMNRKKLFKTTARLHSHLLWVNTNAPIVKRYNTLHVMDYNLFWYDIRYNAKVRVDAYLANANSRY